MTWTWEEIQRGWLRDETTTTDYPEVWVECFNRLEHYFGRDWIDQARIHGGIETWGIHPTLGIVSEGARLEALDGVRDASHLIEKLCGRDPSAWAELTAIWLLKSGDPDVLVELEPTIASGSVPDFRIRRDELRWTYVEVTQPNTSETQQELRKILTRLSTLLETIPGRYALEVYLRRDPTLDEVDAIVQRMPDFCQLEGIQAEELPNGLGGLYLNETAPGLVAPQDRGDGPRPRLGQARSYVENGVAIRHIAVRLGFSDDRADAFLRAEARQLPKDAPGLIMIQTAATVGGFRTWIPLLERRLQPTIHTRVSAISLFESSIAPTGPSIGWRPEARTLLNAHARLQAPPWIVSNLERFPPLLAKEFAPASVPEATI
jgi:hypothetical protein